MNRSRRLAAAVLGAAVLAAAIPAGASAFTTITASGATGSFPLIQLLAQKYTKLKPGKVKFKIAQGGGEVGINDAESGKVIMGNAARDPKSSDPKDLKWFPIAKDSFCFDVNPKNGLTNVDTATAIAIWTGKIRDWSQVPGSGLTGTIDLIGRTSASSLPPLVQSLLLGGKAVSSLASLKPLDSGVQTAVATDANAIGYNSSWYASQKNVKKLAYNGVACAAPNVKSGQYPGVRTFYEVTKGVAPGGVGAFITWVQKSAAAKKIIQTQWVALN